MLKALQFVAILLTAISMSAGWAHLLELPNKMTLSRDDYLVVQQIYRGWAWLGIAVIGSLFSAIALAFVQRGRGAPCRYAIGAALCIAASLVVFFTVTFPVNQATQNWLVVPENWQALRWRWEYSHAANAALYFLALALLVLSALTGRRRRR